MRMTLPLICTALLLAVGLPAAQATPPSDPAVDPEGKGDVVAELEILASPDALRDKLTDLRNFGAFWPEGCTARFELGDKVKGEGASALITYRGEGIWRRKLTAVVSEVKEKRVTIDHPGNKGFPTTFDLVPGAQGTVVTMHTWVYPPPKPFQKTYFKRTQPHWQTCQEGFLRGLAASVATGG